MMKLGALGLVLSAAVGLMSIGCGPGLSHHGVYAQSPAAPVAKEVGTTTLTSDTSFSPGPTQLRVEVRRPIIPAVQWDDDATPTADDADDAVIANPGLQTWGKKLSVEEKYGF